MELVVHWSETENKYMRSKLHKILEEYYAKN